MCLCTKQGLLVNEQSDLFAKGQELYTSFLLENFTFIFCTFVPLLSTHSGITSSITNGLEKKYLFVVNPQANPTKKIRMTARKIEKGLKSLMISVLKKHQKFQPWIILWEIITTKILRRSKNE